MPAQQAPVTRVPRIGMLGPFEVRTGDGGVVDVPGARLRGLLASLALEPGRVVPKATLVDRIWGEDPPSEAGNALQRLVSRLRRVLPDGSVEGRAGGYRLAVDGDAVDAVRFERLAGQARNAEDARRVTLLREALALWRGAAMQDVALQDGAGFEAVVARLEGLRLAAMEDRFEAEIRLGRGAELVPELTDLVAAHPLRERLVAALMRAHAAAGRSTEALTVYQQAREALAEALGADPSPELSALHVTLLRGEPGPQQESRKTNLRAELTSFVGRDADVAAVRGLIGDHRLATLIGPGGFGKTRLATETARALAEDPPDGAWLVELAAIGPQGDVAQAALGALGLREHGLLGGTTGGESTDGLIAAMREREALLILDNCEHVIDSAAAFAHRVLGECRGLRILATSREPLGITGEALWQVEPLALPQGDAVPGERAFSAAVRLLRDRAGAVRKDLAVDAPTMANMVRVCRALDGMPLAIELAAARLRTMSIDQLAERIDDRFALLTRGSRTALPRHRTLRAVVDWSWELLTDDERMVLRRLAVFAGGASLEAAEQVCAGDAVEAGRMLEVLTSLTEKSLVLTESERTPRYRMLTTIKEYAEQRLAEAGESDRARQAHLAYFTELAETAEPYLRRAEQMEWLAALEADRDNIAAALRGAIEAGDAPGAMRLAAAAGWYWWLGGHKAEGNELIRAAAALPGEVADESRAVVYTLVASLLSSGRGDEHMAADWVHKAYRFGRRARRRHPLVDLVVPLERMLQAPDTPLAAWEPLLDAADPWVRAMARFHLGKMRIMIGQGVRDAQAYLEAALGEFRTLGERLGISLALSHLGDLIAMHGEFVGACEYYEQGIAAMSEVGAIEDVIQMRTRQALLYWLAGDHVSSAAAIAEAERRAEGITWPHTLIELALAKAELARRGGDTEEARRQLGAATTLLGDDAESPHIRAGLHDVLGYLAEDLREARTHRVAAWQAASEGGRGPAILIAQLLVGFADLALRSGHYEQAVRLLAAGTTVRGLPDRSHPDAARIERDARRHLGDARFAEVTQEGAQAHWSELVEVTLASERVGSPRVEW